MTKNEYIASIMLEAADLLKEDAYHMKLDTIREYALQESFTSRLREIALTIIEKIIHICRHVRAFFESRFKGDIELNSDHILDVDATLRTLKDIHYKLNKPEELKDINLNVIIDTRGNKINRNKLVSVINNSETLARKIQKYVDDPSVSNAGIYVDALKYIQRISNYVLHLKGELSESDLVGLESKANKKDNKSQTQDNKTEANSQNNKGASAENGKPFTLRKQSQYYANGHIKVNDEIRDILMRLGEADQFSSSCISLLSSLRSAAGIDIKFAAIKNVLPVDTDAGKGVSRNLFVELYKEKKINIPAGTELYHVSPEKNLRSLSASYKSDTSNACYKTGRIYFSIGKPMNFANISMNYSGDEYIYKYVPKNNIAAYVDTEYMDNTNIYIEANSIPVELVGVNKK